MATPSPFTILEHSFALLGAPPDPLAIDSRQLGHHAPAPQIPIGCLRSILTNPTASLDLQARIIDVVVAQLQQDRDPWVVALGGLLLPALRRLADQAMARSRQPSPLEVEAELLSRLLLATRRPPHHTRRFAMQLLQQPQG